MKVITKAESLLWHCCKKMYEILGERRFCKAELNANELDDYDRKKEWWEDEKHKVHGDLSDPVYYYNCIDEVMRFESEDNVVDVGCGDGLIDSYLPDGVNLFGIDFSNSKIEDAKSRNPEFVYRAQSFLDRIEPTFGCNKCFSYGVLQYCKPEDVDVFIKNSIDSVMSTVNCKEKIIGHIEVPDKAKAYDYYYRLYGIAESTFEKYKEKIQFIFQDGSYWHDMYLLKESALNYLRRIGVEGEEVQILNSRCFYRSSLFIKFKLKDK